MPNVWTHLLFGQEALAAADLGRSIEEDRSRRLFNLGCQGPDFYSTIIFSRGSPRAS